MAIERCQMKGSVTLTIEIVQWQGHLSGQPLAQLVVAMWGRCVQQGPTIFSQGTRWWGGGGGCYACSYSQGSRLGEMGGGGYVYSYSQGTRLRGGEVVVVMFAVIPRVLD